MLTARFRRIPRHLFLLTALILFYGCERDESGLTNGYGTLALHLEADNKVIELGSSAQTKSSADSLQTAHTRVSDDIPSVEDFELYMYANGVLAEYWETFSQYDPTQQFSVGNYEMKAVYGSIDKEGFYSPYYEGTTSLQIKNRENTEAEITCKLSNVKVSIACTDAVKKYFKTFSMQLRSELNNSIEIGKDETRSVYLKPGLLVLNVQFEKQNGTSKNLELLRIEETEGQQHYLINVDVNNGEVGSGTLEITYHTVQSEEIKEIDLSDASLNIKEPVFTTQGFENGASMTLREGAQPEALKVTLNARAGRKQSLAGDKRRARDDAAFGGFKRAECVLPVADTAREVIDLGMGQYGEHTVAHFLLKAVHHRKHDDECHDAQGDGSDRNARNKAHETVFATAASTGSRVAQSDGNFKRKSQDVFSRIGLLF